MAKKINRLINKYLRNEETTEERIELMEWFDELGDLNQDQSVFSSGQKEKAKERFFAAISSDSKAKENSNKKIILAIAASVLLFFAGYWAIQENRTEKFDIASTEVLEQHHRTSTDATLELADGTLLSLRDGEGFSDSRLKRNEEGQWVYLQNEISHEEEAIKNNVLTTPHTAQVCIVLPDQTKVWLNAGSKLEYPARFGEGDRVVKLEGEAYFQVYRTSDKSRFVVETAKQKAVVLGTHFNIKAYPDQEFTQTALEKGSIRIEGQKNEGKVVLKPNEQATLSKQGLSSKKVDVDEVISWTRGFFFFDGQNTEEALMQIARWYDIDIDFKSSEKPYEYKGKIPRNLQLNKLIELLEFAELKVQPRMKDDKINLLIEN